MLVVESAAHAAARGARVHGRLTGAGITNDSHHVAQPAPGGPGCAAAVDAALRDAGLVPEQIQHVNAHATATPLGDLGEAQALHSVFAKGVDDVTVSATKGAFGHTSVPPEPSRPSSPSSPCGTERHRRPAASNGSTPRSA